MLSLHVEMLLAHYSGDEATHSLFALVAIQIYSEIYLIMKRGWDEGGGRGGKGGGLDGGSRSRTRNGDQQIEFYDSWL